MKRLPLPPEVRSVRCPVQFDFAVASEAAAEARRHARYLRSLADARVGARAEAVKDWTGRFRDDFDREYASTQQALRDRAQSVDSMAKAIDDAADRARIDKATCEREHDHSKVPTGPNRPR
jgi:uncharacterized protein YukE